MRNIIGLVSIASMLMMAGVDAKSASFSRPSSPSISRPSISVPKPSAPTFTRPAAPPMVAKPSIPDVKPSASVAPPMPKYTRPTAPVSPALANTKPVIQPPTPQKQTEVDKRLAQGQSATALKSFQQTQASYKSLPVAAPATPQAAAQSPVYRQYGSRWSNSDAYFRGRADALASMPPQRASYWNSPPVYVINARPSYGSYSGAFMGAMIGSAIVNGSNYAIEDSYARWAYAHRQSVEYQQWHADMMAQAEQDAEVRARMRALDTAVDTKVQSGAAVDENALPEGIPPELAVAPDTVMMATSKEGAPPPPEVEDESTNSVTSGN